MIRIEIPMGAFHDVKAIKADRRFLSILNSRNLEFLIPLQLPAHVPLPPHFGPRQAFEDTGGVQYLDHLDIRDLSGLAFDETSLSLTTVQGVTFQWHVYLPSPSRSNSKTMMSLA